MLENNRYSRVEKESHRRAFEFYYSLGYKRTYKAVAAEFGVCVSTIKNWSHWFRWQDRLADREAEIIRQMADKTLQEGVEHNERDLRIVQAALVRVAKEIAGGKIKTQLKDLDWLIPLEHRLRGVPFPEADQPDERKLPKVILNIGNNGMIRPGASPPGPHRHRQ